MITRFFIQNHLIILDVRGKYNQRNGIKKEPLKKGFFRAFA